ncbi:MAG TPA: FlgD immunoglobulin-like domain containing protein [Candidatus Krumholzibacteria bacterium]|nr:FlgD immunoglobulin-like domain containing protein [Candidatus Krumholzibacteria bacterium]
MQTTRVREIVILAFAISILAGSAARAQFWTYNGSAVCTSSGTQDYVDIIREGSAGTGAVMVWHDNRSGANYDIYAQRLGANGSMMWAGDGVAICSAPGTKLLPLVSYEGFGLYSSVWEDSRGGGDVYAAIFNTGGGLSTPLAGLPIATGGSYQRYVALASNPSLGVDYVAWMDDRNGNDDVYVQAFNVFNYGFMAANGQAACTASDTQGYPVIVSNGGDGCITAWLDYRNGYWDVYAQNMGLGGNIFWPLDGVLVSSGTTEAYRPVMVSDGAGGAIISWIDNRDGAQDIYAQRLDYNGNQVWGIGGVAVRAIGGGTALFPRMVADGQGNVLIAWQDDRGPGYDIYVQRIDAATGQIDWAFNGVGACTEAFGQTLCDVTTDGSGGAVITWQDARATPPDLYAQRVNASGSTVWDAGGMPVCTAVQNQINPRLVHDGSGGSIVAWTDKRTELFGGDIYAVRIENAAGLWGYPEPVILSVTVVPHDQGGFVNVTWRRGETTLNFFQVYRRPLGAGSWDFVNVQGDDSSPTWSMVVPTTADAVPGNPNLHEFRVDGYTFGYDVLTAIATGSSVDNIAPPAPTLSGARNGNNVELSWNSTAPDIDHYVLQRADFGPIVVSGTSYTDVGAPLTTLYYRVNAIDIHSNSGPNSNQVTIDHATPIGDTPALPSQLTLLPNTPNPFGASTELHVGLPKAADAHLEVYDVAGRRVLTRDLGRLAAGWRRIDFDGRDDRGQSLSAGVYFYRVTVANQTLTRKMVIAR